MATTIKFLDTNGLSHYSSILKSTFATKTDLTDLVNSAPATLDTLKELADALGNDKDFAVTVANSLAKKYDKLESATVSNVPVFGTNGTLVDSGRTMGVNIPTPTGNLAFFLRADGTWANPVAAKTEETLVIPTDGIKANSVVELTYPYVIGTNTVTVYINGVKCKRNDTFTEVKNASGDAGVSGTESKYLKFNDDIDADYDVEVVIG